MSTNFAVRGVMNKLNEDFGSFNFLFAEFYDFERGLDPYFKRRLQQTPMEQRGKNWVSIMWSRDPRTTSWNNRQYFLVTDSSDLFTKSTDIRYVYCSVVFTYISNSLSYLENMENSFFRYIPNGFSTMYDFTPYKEWTADSEVKEGYIRVSRPYNGYRYVCVKAGRTGNQEPTWSSTQEVSDGTVIWKPQKPDQFRVQFDNVAYSGLSKYSLDSEDTLCKFDIGGRMFFPAVLGNLDPDSGDLDLSDSCNHLCPRILYPRGDISIADNFPEYIEQVTPTPEYWRNLNDASQDSE